MQRHRWAEMCLCSNLTPPSLFPLPPAHLHSACTPSRPVAPPPHHTPPPLSLSIVVLPCDRGEGSPGGALLGGNGVLLWQALLHLLLPDQDTQVDVLRWRARQRGESVFVRSRRAAAGGRCSFAAAAAAAFPAGAAMTELCCALVSILDAGVVWGSFLVFEL